MAISDPRFGSSRPGRVTYQPTPPAPPAATPGPVTPRIPREGGTSREHLEHMARRVSRDDPEQTFAWYRAMTSPGGRAARAAMAGTSGGFSVPFIEGLLQVANPLGPFASSVYGNRFQEFVNRARADTGEVGGPGGFGSPARATSGWAPPAFNPEIAGQRGQIRGDIGFGTTRTNPELAGQRLAGIGARGPMRSRSPYERTTRTTGGGRTLGERALAGIGRTETARPAPVPERKPRRRMGERFRAVGAEEAQRRTSERYGEREGGTSREGRDRSRGPSRAETTSWGGDRGYGGGIGGV